MRPMLQEIQAENRAHKAIMAQQNDTESVNR